MTGSRKLVHQLRTSPKIINIIYCRTNQNNINYQREVDKGKLTAVAKFLLSVSLARRRSTTVSKLISKLIRTHEKKMNKSADERTKETRKKQRTSERTNERTDGRTNERTKARTNTMLFIRLLGCGNVSQQQQNYSEVAKQQQQQQQQQQQISHMYLFLVRSSWTLQHNMFLQQKNDSCM